MIIHVLRKPLTGTVAANVLTHGCGALNIDECRIGTGKRVPSSAAKDRQNIAKGTERGRTTDTSGFDPNVGRWPTNFVLTHLPACEQVGVKKVRSQNPKYAHVGKGGSRGNHMQYGLAARPHGVGIGFANSDGTETVPDWRCAADCPVLVIDEQSYARGIHSAGHACEASPFRKLKKDVVVAFHGTSRLSPRYGDVGGASRFFQQVGLCLPPE